MLNRFSLRIEHSGLEADINFSFHRIQVRRSQIKDCVKLLVGIISAPVTFYSFELP
jgi:hypothetical protein